MTRAYNINDNAFRWIVSHAGVPIVWKPVKYYMEAGQFANNPLGWILHVTVGNGSPYEMFNNAQPGSRKFSHLFVAKDGHVEQYASLMYKSWAQVDGNDTYWSVETEGFPTEALTIHQIKSLAAIHFAFRAMIERGSFNSIANHPGEPGIGTHQMGGAAWGGHECPGSIRAAQRREILHLSMKMRIV